MAVRVEAYWPFESPIVIAAAGVVGLLLAP
jgi:hypothetical protein